MSKASRPVISVRRQRIINAIDEAENKGDWTPLLATFDEERAGMVNIRRLIPNLPEITRSNHLVAEDRLIAAIDKYQEQQREGFFVAVKWMGENRESEERRVLELRRRTEELRRVRAATSLDQQEQRAGSSRFRDRSPLTPSVASVSVCRLSFISGMCLHNPSEDNGGPATRRTDSKPHEAREAEAVICMYISFLGYLLTKDHLEVGTKLQTKKSQV